MQTPKNEKPRNACGERTGAGTFGKHDQGRNHSATIYASLEDFKTYILSEYGLALVGEIIADGAFHYLATSDDRKGHKPFRYCVHLDDPPNVYFNDLKRGFHGTWYPESQQPLTPAERKARRREIEQHKAQREAETQAKHSKRAAWALKLWNSARPADGTHPYLVRKGVKAQGLRLLPVWEKRTYPDGGGSQFEVIPIENVLLVPMKDSTGALWNLQMIYPEKILLGDEERDRDFLPGAKVTGLFHWIGERTETVCIAEGYATGASIFEATRYRCFVAFSAGNLPHVALAVRAALPDAKIVICGDHDKPDKNGRRAGIEKAEEAAALVGGFVALPPIEKMDFNDFAAMLREAI
ncbi:MAG: toprim domain-containing protein [Proteobacteria bacterium]|nr:toprim domain-containing protein [Pseudomonadota bacterium]